MIRMFAVVALLALGGCKSPMQAASEDCAWMRSDYNAFNNCVANQVANTGNSNAANMALIGAGAALLQQNNYRPRPVVCTPIGFQTICN